MTTSPTNPFEPRSTTGACMVCGEPISHKVRGRPRLYCERVRCRRRGARKRALAAAWEEGLAAEIAVVEAAAARSEREEPTHEDGVREGREAGRAEAAGLVRLLVEKGDSFVRHKKGIDFTALEQAVELGQRWLRARADAEAQRTSPGSS